MRNWKIIIAVAGAAFGLSNTSPASSNTPFGQHTVRVTRINYKGWRNCADVSNGLVEAIVVPEIGRIMAFQFAGHPETSPLFTNSDLLGKTGADVGAGNWANFGGDKLWPSPQSEWPQYIGHTFPPPPAFDGLPERLDVVPGGVRLSTPRSTEFGAESSRVITLCPGDTHLYISQTLRRTLEPRLMSGVNRRNLAGEAGIWSVTQTRGDGAGFLPVNPRSRFPQGFVTFDNDSRPVLNPPSLPFGWTRSDALLTGRRDPVNSSKLGSDNSAGWIASLYSGTVLFSEHFPTHFGPLYPDGGCRTEVYANSGATAYVELELLGPLQKLPNGRQMTYDIAWNLERLPIVPKNDGDAERLVRAAMSRN